MKNYCCSFVAGNPFYALYSRPRELWRSQKSFPFSMINPPQSSEDKLYINDLGDIEDDLKGVLEGMEDGFQPCKMISFKGP